MKKLIYILASALLVTSISSFAGTWVRANNGYIPRGAWAVGYEEDGTPLYLCRAYYRGVHPGKVRRDFGGCNISFAGKELTIRNYTVWVGNPTPVVEVRKTRYFDNSNSMNNDDMN